MDWRDRFRAGSVHAAAVARRRPERGVVIADHGGNREAYAWDVEAASLRRLTDTRTAVVEAAIAPDGESIVYQHDESGSELGDLRRVPFGGGDAVDLTPDLEPYGATLLREGDGFTTGVTADMSELHLLMIRDGMARRWPQRDLVEELIVAADGELLATAEPMDGFTTRTIVRGTADGREVARLDFSRPTASHGRTLAVALHREGWLRPAIWSPGEDPIPIEVDAPGDVVPADWSPDGSTILLWQMHRSVGGLWLYDVASRAARRLEAPEGAPFPGAWPFLLGTRAAGCVWSSAEMPFSVVRLADEGSDVLLTVAEHARYPGTPWTEVTFPNDDGGECQGWLLRPPGTGPWGTILYAHGGPHIAIGPGFIPICQAWADHGWAVLAVNYRGSTTFGDDYREALTGRVGVADVADMVAAHRWLVESGIARPDLVILNGSSWGGYLTLHTMGTHPGRWAAGIAGAPVADWILSAEDQMATLDAVDRALFGTTRAEDQESRIKASPRTYVAQFDAPVLITTPREDSRTPLRPIEAFVADMRSAGKEVRLDILAGGHMGIGHEQGIAVMESWLAFADEIRRRRDTG